MPLPSAVAVFAAAKRIRPLLAATPLRHSHGLSEAAGVEVFLKPEHEQRTGSFKARGALNTLAVMSADERARGIVAVSAGNHGLGIAYAARQFRAPATIFVPSTAPRIKRDGIAALGARVDATSADYDRAHDAAIAYARQHGRYYVDPCLGAPLIAGQGTVGLEILEELPETRTIVVSVGGGGLAAGVGSIVRRAAPDIRIIGVQGDRTQAAARALEAGRVVDVPVVPTLADGLTGQIDVEAFENVREVVDRIVIVSEEEIAAAIAWMYRESEGVAEGAGAVGVAAVLGGRLGRVEGPVVVIVSGGNIDPDVHERVLREGGVRAAGSS
ncbi:MAG TPA: pyridoxal-phosphate dependent enzyme [Gemmatimonadaceae bacterium]|nr:pyridoxal-phosphate dependent enzyme [Gemmatimonadaceae bacterium]